ncbi:MAG: rRNA maturation RNase YbeY [Cyanobacteria bacterium REEB446]|nr:rRNA maturation RNase YbeY [Cyanobacteria bacterium REEB446]
MSRISISNRDSKTKYLNKLDDNEILDIENCVNWSSIAELCIKLSVQEDDKSTENEVVLRSQEANGIELNLHREICLSFCTESEIKDLNHNFRNKDSVTDVLSFNFQDLQNTGEIQPLGDVIICTARAQEQAWELGYTLRRELIFLFAHGVLHLLGYDHETEEDAEKMFKLQKQVIKTYGILD